MIKKELTIEYLRQNELIIFEAVSGSHAFGLSTPESDIDIKGVFILPEEDYLGLYYTPQVSDERNDTVFYEFGRFMELLAENNPNILELLNTPSDSIIYRYPIFDKIKSEMILSKICLNSFGKFAYSQIKKARGLKKKIVNPMGDVRKTVLEFCYVNYKSGSLPLKKYLEIKDFKQENCGLVNIPHMQNVFGLFHSTKIPYRGIIKSGTSNEIRLTSIPKGEEMLVTLYFNKDGYSKYCKEFKEYHDWVKKRNENRYKNNKKHGKGYDTKNMLHTFRLLEMAIEIAREGRIIVRRDKDRDFLLDIKAGKYTYDELIKMADSKQKEMVEAYNNSNLMERPDVEEISKLTSEMRAELYS